MNAGPTAGRVYAALKRQLLDRRFRPGERIDPSRLGDELGSSVTPVRDALHQLIGEGLVEAKASEGFSLPHLDEPALRDLYRWSAAVLQLAARTATAHAMRDAAKHPAEKSVAADSDTESTDVDRAAQLFAAIATQTDNAECVRTVTGLLERTAALRRVEAVLLDGLSEEADALEASWAAADGSLLVRLLGRYHRRRERAAAMILRALYRGS